MAPTSTRWCRRHTVRLAPNDDGGCRTGQETECALYESSRRGALKASSTRNGGQTIALYLGPPEVLVEDSDWTDAIEVARLLANLNPKAVDVFTALARAARGGADLTVGEGEVDFDVRPELV